MAAQPDVLIDTALPTVVSADLVADLPPFEQRSHDINAALTAIANELARVEQMRQEVILNYFPATAQAMLHFFEQELGLAVDVSTLPLAQRRTLVLAYLLGLKSAGSGLSWEQAIAAVAGTGWSYVERADTGPNPYTIEITLPFATAAPVPAGLVATPASGSGTLAAGTYSYAVSALTAYGETLPCTAVSATLGAAGHVSLAWTAQAAPTVSYNVYRGSSPSTLALLASPTTNSYNDTGSVTPAGAPPTADTSGSRQAYTVLQLIRRVTPAHLVTIVDYSAGFIVGYSDVGLEPL